MNHLRAGISLLIIVRHGHAIELCLRIVTSQYTRGIFPSDGRARLYLCPGKFGIYTAQIAALRHQVQHASLALFITGIPVLHGGILHFGAIHHDNLHDGGMQLVLIAHRCRAAFQITHVAVITSHNQRALKLSGIAGIDTEIAAQLHRATHALGNIDKRAVAEHG